ncbi:MULTISPECIES: DMT family transporter [unclassified Pantoea]|uniref:DMT family transporter n=1 Tax=unclassified Pantoea TaxID=2630326 RepID=UPI001CD43D11|nr:MULTISPECIES: DMT family transporter [unclassified Pantoea]MCA1177670.1 DMT family transporter [Pantoea sp. alder69]MCA1249424.1 DMT family transporter [Pantoea sp. alder70]MCA1266159.1 DMT family transporter [Pantoea sp. alder81]
MFMRSSSLTSQAATSGFVLLWGSAAIFSRLGLDNASPMALLIVRFSVALAALMLVGIFRRRWLPDAGSRKTVMLTGLILIGAYSVCYFQAMAEGVTPGLIATIMGIQPILTLCIVERRMQGTRLLGLLIALAGLILLVWRSLAASQLPLSGIVFALGALLCMTFGAIMQKKVSQHPAQVLPLQYAVSLALCALLLPVKAFHIDFTLHFWISVLFLGVMISVVAQLLLYRLLSAGSIVNVTSLFYLVPVITAVLDYLLLGNTLPWSGVMGMLAILLGIMLVFRKSRLKTSG